MIKTYYYAIDKDGQGWYYDNPPIFDGESWQRLARKMNNDYEWTSATDDVFKDCVIPATTFDKGPLQFEIDEQLNTTWYKE